MKQNIHNKINGWNPSLPSTDSLRTSEIRYRRLFEAARDGILILDAATLQIIDANPFMTDLLGYAHAEFMGKELWEIGFFADKDASKAALYELQETGYLRYEDLPLRAATGRRRQVEFVSNVYVEGGDRVIQCNIRDITERAQTEKERRIIFEIIQGVATTANLDEFLSLVHRAISQIIYSENCFVMLYDPVTEVAHYEFWADKHDERPSPGPIGKSFGSYVLRTSEPLLLTADSEKRMYEEGEAEQIGSSSPSWLGVPLRTQSQTIGVLVLQHYEKENAYSQRDLEFLSSVGDQIAVAIERKRADEALSLSEERYRELVENALDIIYTHDLKGNYTSVNKAAERITGYSRDEALAMNIADMVAPEFLEKAKVMIAAKLAGDEITAYELETIAKDGHRIALEVNTRIIYENGLAFGVQGIARDVTERKRADEELRWKTAFLEAQVNSTIDGILVVSHVGKKILQNQRISDLFKIPRHISDDPDDRKQIEWVTGRVKHPERFIEKVVHLYAHPDEISRDEIELKDGTILDRYSAPVIGKEDQNYGRIWTFRDITGLRRADEALIESESRLRTIIATEPECVKLLDEDGLILEMNPAGRRMVGADSLADIEDLSVFTLVVEKHRPAFRKLLEAVFRGESGTLEFEIVGLKGTACLMETHSSPLRDATGKIIALLAIARDITERRRTEDELRESEVRYRAMVEWSPESIAVTRDGKLLYLNPAALAMMGAKSEKEMIGKRLIDLVHADYRDLVLKRIKSQKSSRGILPMIKQKMIKLDGTIIEVESQGRSIDYNGAAATFYSMRDITDRTRAEEALRESNQKFLQLADNITDAFWIRSLDMTEVLYISPAFERIWGRSVASLYKDPHEWSDFIYPEDRIFVHAAFDALIGKSVGLDIEYRIVRPAGEIRWVRLRGFEVKDEQAVVIRYAGIATDITESKRAANEIGLTLQRLNDAQRMGKIGDWTLNVATGEITWSKEVFEISERDPLLGAPKDYEEHARPYDSASRELMAEKVAKAIETGEAQEYELVLRPDGERTVYVQAMCEARRDDRGQVFALNGTIQDISARKMAQLALKESEFRYHSLFENMLEGYAYCETLFEGDQLQDFVYLEVNGAFETLTGLKNVVGKKVSDILPGIQQADRGLFETYGRVALTGKPEKFETYVKTLGLWLSITVYSSDKKHFVAVFDNITERKLANAQLAESRQRLELATESAGIGIWDWDVVADKLVWDKKVFDLYGIAEPDFSGAYIAWKNGIHPDDLESAEAFTVARLKGSGDHLLIDFRVLWPNGEVHNIESRARVLRAPDGSALRMIGVNYDITDRKHANQALRESEDRYRTLFETSPDGVAMFDMHMNVLVANGRSAEIFGYPNASEMIGKNAFDLIAPQFRDRAGRNFNAIREFGQLAPVESKGIRADGSEFAVEFSATLVRDTDRQPVGVLGVVRDITERKQAEEKLIRSESNLAKSQEIAHLGSWEMDIPESGDVNRGHLRWSDEVFRIFGYKPGEIEVNNGALFEAVHPGDRANVTAAMAEALREGKDFRIDHRILLPDGSERSVHEHSEIIVDAQSGKPIRMIGTIQDVTSEKQLEEQLRQAQKMEAIGVLAGGIAHDFNNLLTAINGYGDLTLRKMPADDPLRGNVQEIRNAGERGAALTEQLLSFSRKNVLQPKVHNLNPLLTEIEKMLRRIVRENIELRTVLDPELGNINADPGQIEQVIMNLAVNARDAMPNGGTLTIETKNIYLDKDYVSQHIAVTPGRFVKMTVTDNGEGMDEKTQRRAFEPFFSTKEVGKGTGLGLSTVFGIVKQSGGDIMVYSEVGHGTTFKIYLPRVDDDVEKSRWKEDIEEEGSYSGSETILLVEDETIVRTLVRDVLKSNGYRVLETASGPEALSVCSTYSEPIQLLLTDVIMPKMSGSELSVMVTEQRPEIKVLFMSGYTDDAISEGGFLDRGTAFIEKPFSPDSLTRKIRETLDS